MKTISSNFLYTVLAICAILISSCKHKSEFQINGVDYYTKKICVKDTTWTEFGYRYGYSFRGRFEYSYGTIRRYECLESLIDTLKCN